MGHVAIVISTSCAKISDALFTVGLGVNDMADQKKLVNFGARLFSMNAQYLAFKKRSPRDDPKPKWWNRFWLVFYLYYYHKLYTLIL